MILNRVEIPFVFRIIMLDILEKHPKFIDKE